MNLAESESMTLLNPAAIVYATRGEGWYFAVATDDLGRYGQGVTVDAAVADMATRTGAAL